eukprot:scaffold9889_cov109-Isochrysis_galbana.AAC.1
MLAHWLLATRPTCYYANTNNTQKLHSVTIARIARGASMSVPPALAASFHHARRPSPASAASFHHAGFLCQPLRLETSIPHPQALVCAHPRLKLLPLSALPWPPPPPPPPPPMRGWPPDLPPVPFPPSPRPRPPPPPWPRQSPPPSSEIDTPSSQRLESALRFPTPRIGSAELFWVLFLVRVHTSSEPLLRGGGGGGAPTLRPRISTPPGGARGGVSPASPESSSSQPPGRCDAPRLSAPPVCPPPPVCPRLGPGGGAGARVEGVRRAEGGERSSRREIPAGRASRRDGRGASCRASRREESGWPTWREAPWREDAWREEPWRESCPWGDSRARESAREEAWRESPS